MQAERDWLREHVLPALEERLRERYRDVELRERPQTRVVSVPAIQMQSL